MIFSKLFWNTRLGDDLSLAPRRDRGPSIAGGCGDVGQRPLVADKTIQIFVCGAAKGNAGRRPLATSFVSNPQKNFHLSYAHVLSM